VCRRRGWRCRRRSSARPRPPTERIARRASESGRMPQTAAEPPSFPPRRDHDPHARRSASRCNSQWGSQRAADKGS
jgi:hypothetical protein